MATSIKQKQLQMKKALSNTDGWVNVLSGLGGKKDKGQATTISSPLLLRDEELSDIYLSGGLGTVITDIVADDMTREWIYVEDKTVERKDANKIIDILTALKAQTKFNEATKWARLYGGAIIIVGAIDNGKLDMPLNTTRIKELLSLRVVDRTCIDFQQSVFNTDVNSPNFGSIEKFSVRLLSPTGVETTVFIHHSRCLVFNGKTIPSALRGRSLVTPEQLYWGLSEVQFLFESMAQHAGIRGAIVNALHEFTVGKISIKNLANLMASGKEEQVMSRMTLIAMMKSSINAIMLDEGESFSRETISLSDIPEILDRFMMDISMASRIPVTKLFGRSASGMNATGEGDQDNYYDDVKSRQELNLKPQIAQLVNIIKTKEKITSEIEITFNSLYQMDEKEIAEIAEIEERTKKIKAEKEKLLVEAGIVSAESVYDAEYAEKYLFEALPTGEE